MKECRYHSKIVHTYILAYEVTVKFALFTELIQFYIPTY